MHLPIPLWLACSLFLQAGPSYQAIVVDATTSRPLPGVSVLDLTHHTGLATDETGHFSLPGPVAHFRLQSLGFAVLESERPARSPGQVDTLRLLPSSILLSNVSVRPTKPQVLASVEGKGTEKHGGLVVPGSQYGVLFRPAANSAPAVVQHITIQLRPNRPTAGRVRVRLVAVEPGEKPWPSAHDLLPVAATYTAAELASAGEKLVVDLSANNLRLPAEGLFVLVEGLPTVPGESYVKMDAKMNIITALNPKDPSSYSVTPMRAFPSVEWATSETQVETVGRTGYNMPWQMHRVTNKPQKSENMNISLEVIAE